MNDPNSKAVRSYRNPWLPPSSDRTKTSIYKADSPDFFTLAKQRMTTPSINHTKTLAHEPLTATGANISRQMYSTELNLNKNSNSQFKVSSHRNPKMKNRYVEAIVTPAFKSAKKQLIQAKTKYTTPSI